MFAGSGSAMIAATGALRGRSTSASGSFHATTAVSAATVAGTPGLAGIPAVARPDPAAASRPSEWP